MKRIDVQINHKLVGTCEAVIRSSSPLFKDVIEPWIEIRGFTASSPSLTDDQQVVLEWLKEAYERAEWSSPFGSVYSTINNHEYFLRMNLDKEQQFQVLAAFGEWGNKSNE